MRRTVCRNVSKPNSAAALDEALKECRNILALSELLIYGNAEHLHPQTIVQVGSVIGCQAQNLRRQLEQFYRLLPKAG